MKKFNNGTVEVQYSLEDLKIKIGAEKAQTVKSKSEMFRMLYDAGMEINEIAKECESHYSFVYGVISASRVVRKVTKTSASDIIRELYDQGKKPGEIAKELNKNYSFVFGVVKKYKESKELPVAKEA